MGIVTASLAEHRTLVIETRVYAVAGAEPMHAVAYKASQFKPVKLSLTYHAAELVHVRISGPYLSNPSIETGRVLRPRDCEPGYIPAALHLIGAPWAVDLLPYSPLKED